jgi:Flp pilus assembly protein TadB
MQPRALLMALIAVATAGFIVGTTVERNSRDTHSETSSASKALEKGSEGGSGHKEGSSESSERHNEGSSGRPGGKKANEELKPLGIDIEAAPFVALAALVSLLLALGAWLRPRWLLLLAVVATAMLVFAALDVREVFHQVDESKTGLALLAGFVALLHFGAGAVAGAMGRDAKRAPA